MTKEEKAALGVDNEWVDEMVELSGLGSGNCTFEKLMDTLVCLGVCGWGDGQVGR